MKCKAVHIGREKRNTFGTVLRSNSGSISSAGRPVHCCEELYEDLHSCTCPQKKPALGCTWNKYTVSNPGCKETFTGGAPRLLLAESQCVYCKISSKEHERTARTHGCRKKMPCEEWPTLCTLQGHGRDRSVYINENIKKVSLPYLVSRKK